MQVYSYQNQIGINILATSSVCGSGDIVPLVFIRLLTHVGMDRIFTFVVTNSHNVVFVAQLDSCESPCDVCIFAQLKGFSLQ